MWANLKAGAQRATRRVLLCSILLVSLAPWAASEGASPSTDLANRETRTLGSCAPIAVCPVFFVSALGGQFPIPTRYMLVSRPGQARVLTFTSPALPLQTRADAISPRYLSGLISIGLASELRERIAEGSTKLETLKQVGTITVSRLQIVGKPELSQGYDGNGTVVLMDNRDYIEISDQNRELAELLLNLFVRSRNER